MRYCIGCRWLAFDPGERQKMGSEWTGLYGGAEAEFACKRDHWRLEVSAVVDYQSQPTQIVDIARAMEKAETCVDYVEREVPTT